MCVTFEVSEVRWVGVDAFNRRPKSDSIEGGRKNLLPYEKKNIVYTRIYT